MTLQKAINILKDKRNYLTKRAGEENALGNTMKMGHIKAEALAINTVIDELDKRKTLNLWKQKKKDIIKGLIELDEMEWTEEMNQQVFPYLITETLNILKNSIFIDEPIDYAKTGEDAKKLKTNKERTRLI